MFTANIQTVTVEAVMPGGRRVRLIATNRPDLGIVQIAAIDVNNPEFQKFTKLERDRPYRAGELLRVAQKFADHVFCDGPAPPGKVVG